MRCKRRAVLLALTCALLLAGGCKLGGPKYPEAWRDDEVEVGSERLLWEVTAFALNKEDFPVGSGMDPSSLVATSGWKNSLAPFRGKGWRERAQVRYEKVAPKRYRISVRVEHELNMDIARPTDLRYAQWEESPDNEVAASILLQRIKSWLGAGAVPQGSGDADEPGGGR